MMKAGAVFEKCMSEHFDATNNLHLRGWALRQRLGYWPLYFCPSGVYFSSGCDAVIKQKVGNFVPEEVNLWVDEYMRLRGIIEAVIYPGYEVCLGVISDEFFIQVEYKEPDVLSGIEEQQQGRKWVFEAGQTAGQVIQTIFKALLTSLEHRAREHFLYNGKAVLQPHMNINEVWRMM